MERFKGSGKYVASVLVALVLVFGVAVVGKAGTGFWDNVAQRLAQLLAGQVGTPPAEYQQEESFGASGTRFPNGLSVDSTSPAAGELRGTTMTITGSTSLGATTTLQEVVRGSRYSGSLTFTAGATTTPGGLFAIQNTGSPKLCGPVQLSITTGSTVGGPDAAGDGLVFAIATSTAANNLSSGLRTLMASTTVATGTTPIIDSIINPGTYVGGDQDIGGATWRWDSGVYVIGMFDEQTLSADGSAYATSSDIYTSMAGKYYIDCISE